MRGEDAPGQVAGEEAEQADDERDARAIAPVEPLVDDERVREDGEQGHEAHEGEAGGGGPPDHRCRPDAVGPAVRHRPGDLLLQRLHEPVPEGEHGGPQDDQRAVVGRIELAVGDAQEDVGRHPAHHESHRDGHRAFGQRVDASRAC